MTNIKRFNQINESNEPNDRGIRQAIKHALENMYMFGGMPKPDPNYDSYMDRMIEMVMNAVKEKYEDK
ncbi:MAG: hypothetical protein ACOC3V_00715 [bacterium]